LLKTQEAMKHKADLKRREVTYNPGDWVLLKLRPHRQVSAKGSEQVTNKLSKRFFGPFQVVERVGKVAYRLQLPPEAKLHPVFHCSLLKLFHGDPAVASDTFTGISFDQQRPVAPLVILPTRRTGDALIEVLFQWQGLSPDDATWENWDILRDEFHLEDKVLLHGPWNDTEEHTLQSTITEERATTMAANQENAEATEQRVQLANRPKRPVIKPSYLRDYV